MKLVPESLNEAVNFQRGVDPKASMTTGIYDLSPWEREQVLKKAHYKENAKRKGPLKSRTNHEFGYQNEFNSTHGYNRYSKGYRVWKVLEYLLEAGEKGLSREDIVKFLTKMSGVAANYPGWGSSTWFNLKGNITGRVGVIIKYTDKIHPKTGDVITKFGKHGRYRINEEGLKALEKYRKLFNP